MELKFWEATATLVGVIIGAGIFGIPYVVAKSGFITGAIVILFLGIVALLIYLYIGEVVLRTTGKHQLTGYAEIYLGKWGKRAMLFSMIFGLYGAMIAYLLGEASTLSALFGGPKQMYLIIFFGIVSLILYFGIGVLKKSELVSVLLVLLTVAVIIVFTFPHVKTSNLYSFDITKSFIPFGVVLFAYLGMVAVPEAAEILGQKKKKLKNAIIAGLIIPIVVYFLFTLIVVGSIGLEGFESLGNGDMVATIALGSIIHPKLFILANLFAVFAMFTSFIAVGFALKEMFIFDYNIPEKPAWAITCIVPLLISLSGFTNFIEAINISGVVSGGIMAILIVLMFHQAKKLGSRTPEYSLRSNRLLSFLLCLVFVAGAVFVLL